MALPARVTLRCVHADLTADWGSEEHRRHALVGQSPADLRWHDLDHSAIKNAVAVYNGDASADTQRESISGLTDPPWWKVKSSRWRGAVWIDPETNQPWLCAAGIRIDGSGDDFYASFMADVGGKGAAYFLPTEEDRSLLRTETAALKESEWATSISRSVLDAVAEAATNGTATRDLPGLVSSAPAASITIEVETTRDQWDPEGASEEPAGVAIQLQIRDYSQPAVHRRIQVLACWTISPVEHDWDAAPDAVGIRLLATISEARLRQLSVASSIPDGESSDLQRGEMQPTTKAHYAPQRILAEAIVERLSVRALCGIWFVPRQDHTGLPICEGCEDRYERSHRD